MALALSLPLAGSRVWAQTSPATASSATASPPKDRPDAGPPLLDPNIPRQTTGTDDRSPGVPPPRSLDSKRAPVPDRLMLPADMEDIPLAPPTPPVPPMDGAKGGGPNRMKKILKSQGGGQSLPRDSATRTPEDQVQMPGPKTMP